MKSNIVHIDKLSCLTEYQRYILDCLLNDKEIKLVVNPYRRKCVEYYTNTSLNENKNLVLIGYDKDDNSIFYIDEVASIKDTHKINVTSTTPSGKTSPFLEMYYGHD